MILIIGVTSCLAHVFQSSCFTFKLISLHKSKVWKVPHVSHRQDLNERQELEEAAVLSSGFTSSPQNRSGL